jgi:hypothetical protein
MVLVSEKITTRKQKKLGEINHLQRRRFCIVVAARKTKPQRNHAPPAKPNSTADRRRRANPRPKWTRLRLNLVKDGPRLPLPWLKGRDVEERGQRRAATAAQAGEGGSGSRVGFFRGYVHFQLRLLTAEPQTFNIIPTES